ncbi:MAG: BNR-repeat neuraminidase N-terminal domain-containing protein [Crocinitomicaceae bacterium]|nr:BNR-repeat neuraminidase N-terminal domain-containing protein [Crocinitomicaceae bacterium]
MKYYSLLLVFLLGGTAFSQYSLDFDGANDKVQTTFNGILGTASRTVECWVMVPTTTTGLNGGIVAWGANVAGQKWVFRIHGGTGAIRAEVNGGNVTGTTNIRDGQWHHVAVTWEDDGTPDITDALMYVDGVLEAISLAVTEPVNTASGAMAIGSNNGTWGAGTSFLGRIDELRVWNDVRTAAEIQNNWCDIPVPAAEANLVAYYKFDLTTGTVLPDLVAGNDGTLSNMTNTDWVDGVCVSMIYDASTTTQSSITNLENCQSSAHVIGVEVTTIGSMNPIDITQFNIGTAGTTNLAEIASIEIYYTGASPTYAQTNLFATIAPAGTVVMNGTQTLNSGVNYFWIVYTLIVPTVIGNNFDAVCNSIVVDGSGFAPTVTNPAGNITITVCAPTPGNIGQANLKVWYKANAGTGATNTGDLVPQWDDNSPLAAHATQGIVGLQPIYNVANINYNPSLTFDGVDDYISHTLGANSYTSDFTFFTEVQLHTLNPEGAYFHNHNVGSGNGDLTSFQLDSDGTAYRYRNDTEALFGAFNLVPRLFSIYNQNVGGNTEVETFDLGLSTTTASFAANNRGQFFQHYEMGTNRVRLRWSNNSTAEVIVFSAVLSTIDRVKVESYLAIKYGQTLDNSLGGATGDYLATTSALLWDATNNPTYHNDVIGIGRDDNQALYQKQSHSLNDTMRIYLSTLTSSNVLNTGTFVDDVSYITMGHNADRMWNISLPAAEIPTGLTNCVLYSRLEREWKVTKTNITEDFNWDITIPTGAVPAAVNPAHLRLLIDDDGDFSNGGTACYYNGDGSGVVISYSTPVITVANISMAMVPNNITRYMTIASIDEATPLPVGFTNFNIDCIDNQPTLSWTTISELNNSHFTIERSRDGVVYEVLAEINGAGTTTSTNSYYWIDEQASSGTSYYKISQTDFDGTTVQLDIRSVHCSIESFIQVHPNPFHESMTVTAQKSGTITVFDISGKLILNQSIGAGVNIIQTEQISAGSYILQFVPDNGYLQNTKLIKL